MSQMIKDEKYQGGEVFDVAIIGSGPAGMTAAIYCARAMYRTLVIEKMGAGGQAALTSEIENYPGFPDGANGFELAANMQRQAQKFGIQEEMATVEKLEKDENGIFLIATDDETFRAKSVIIASGVRPRMLGVDGEKDKVGRGVSFCATCDGAFYRGKVAAVVGGGDSAVEEAEFLTKFADKVYLIHRRDELRAVKSIQHKVLDNPKVEVLWSTVVSEVLGNQGVEGLKLKSTKDGSESEIAVDGVFLYIGGIANTDFAPDSIKNDKGFVLTDPEMLTTVPGLFAAGDVREKSFRQVATAVGDGALASHSVEKYLGELK